MMLERQPDTILHLGAGRCSEFAEYDASGARRIVLVEANPEVARYLRETYGHDERVEVVERAVSDAAGHGELRLFNVKELSSLREPVGLRELYPGLRETERVSVEVVSLPGLVSELEIERDHVNWLVMDAPGEEATLAKVLCSGGFADVFDRATLHASPVARYDGTASYTELVAMLEGCAYEVQSQDDADPDRLVATLFRDAVRVENAALHERLEAAETLAAERAEEITRLTGEREELSATVSGLREQLSSVQSDLERRTAEQRELESQNRQSEKRVVELQERLAAMSKENETHARTVEELREKVAALTKDQENRDKALQTTNDLNEESQRNQAKLNQEIVRAEAQIDLIKDVLLSDRAL